MTPFPPGSGPDPDPPGPEATKQEWRRWARIKRPRCVPEAVSAAVTAGLATWLAEPGTPRGVVVLYLPLPDEVDVTHLMVGAERRFAVTRTPSEGSLTLHPAGAPRERHRYGFEQPVAGAPQTDPDEVGVVLVPGLVFDRAGGRLGRGGGYYDRFLLTVPRDAARVGIVPQALVVEAVPMDAHDVPMTHLAAESGVSATPLQRKRDTDRAYRAVDP